jgi:hypothetical protein
MMSSGTVPAGEVISETPAAGTYVSPGSGVNLVVSTGAVTLKSIAVTPTSPAIVKGDTQQFTATGTYSDGSTKNITTSVTWASGTTSVATISAGGLATGAGVGMSNITASLSGVTSPADALTVTASAGPPTVVSVSPSSGSGLTQTFTGVYSDPNGAGDLGNVRILVSASTGVNACYVFYYPGTNLLYLENNAGTGLSSGITPGSSAQLSNSQCTVSGTGSSYAVSGNNGTLAVALTFSGTFTGQKNVSLLAQENNNGSSSGWVQEGTWTPSPLAAPTVVSVSPSSGFGLTQTFTAKYSDSNGTSDLENMRVLVSASTGANACYVFYYPSPNLLYLDNNAGTGLSAGITPGSSSQVSNSQCTLSGTGSSYGVSGNTATLAVALTFSGTYTGQKNISLLAQGNDGSSSGWVTKGTWTPASVGPPTVISVSPNSGSGLTQTFTSVYSDPNGAGDLGNVRILVSASTGVNACYVFYYPGSNLLYLENNAGTGLSAGIAPGSSSQVSNSQCTLAGTGSSYGVSGNNATLAVALTFSGTFTGQKNVSLLAQEINNSSSGWLQEGTWTP